MTRGLGGITTLAMLALLATGCATEFDPAGYLCTEGLTGECLAGWTCVAGHCIVADAGGVSIDEDAGDTHAGADTRARPASGCAST